MSDWLKSLDGVPNRDEILDTVLMIEAALTSMVHRRDKVPAKLRHEINVRAREPLLHLLISGRSAEPTTRAPILITIGRQELPPGGLSELRRDYGRCSEGIGCARQMEVNHRELAQQAKPGPSDLRSGVRWRAADMRQCSTLATTLSARFRGQSYITIRW